MENSPILEVWWSPSVEAETRGGDDDIDTPLFTEEVDAYGSSK
jgi:hypothetical protein